MACTQTLKLEEYNDSNTQEILQTAAGIARGLPKSFNATSSVAGGQCYPLPKAER